MAASLPRGGNTSLSAVIAETQKLTVTLEWGGDSPAEPALEACAFMLVAGGKVRSEADMLSSARVKSARGAVVLQAMQKTTDLNRQAFLLDLSLLEDEIEKIAFCLSIHHVVGGVVSIGQLHNLTSRISAGAEIVNSTLALQGSQDTALVMCEVYKRNGEWKFKSVGQGFGAGLAKMAEGFGVQLAEEAQAVGGNVGSAGKAINLGPPAASFEKPYNGFGEIKVELTWSAPKADAAEPAKKGLLGGLLGGGAAKAPPRMDLDLCALYELTDGYRGVVQSLGESLGNYNTAPYMQLMGDSRDGDESGVAREIIRINGARWHELKRVLIYAMIFEGPPNWVQAGGKAFVRVPDQLPVSIRLDQNVNNKRACSICVIENIGDKFAIHKRVETFKNPRELDEAYAWGLQWKSGAKD